MAEVENLFPEELDELTDEDELDEDESELIVGFKTAPYFDSKTGDFVMDGSGGIVLADEISAYTQWCEAILATDRYNHEAYTEDIGLDYNEIFAAADREEAEAIIESEISEALACDPYGRTLFVQNVEFDWISPDEILVEVEIVAFDNEHVTVNTTIQR